MVKKIKLKARRKQSIRNSSSIKKAVISSPTRKTQKDAWILGILFLAFCAVTITFPGFSWVLPNSETHLFFYGSWKIALFLLSVLFLYARFLSQDHEMRGNDISSFWGRFGLWIGLGFTIFLCFYHMDKPIGAYSFDLGVILEIVRRMKDFWNFSDVFISKSYGILPVWPYTAFFFWNLFPADTGLEIQRLTCTFYELGTVWAMYLCGKEIAGRRVGLLAAILASISEPLITKAVSGYPCTSMVFGVTLVIWAQIRLLRKNSIVDFLLWAASIGFFSITTSLSLVLIPFFIFSCLALLWWKNRTKISLVSAPYSVWISLIAYLFYFLCCLNFISNGDRFVSQVKHFSLLIFLIVVAIIGFLYMRLVSRKIEDLWFKWLCGAWAAVVLSFFTFTDDYTLGRIKWHTIVPGASYISSSNLSEAFFKRFPETIKGLFWIFKDIREDMMVPNHSIFSYPETIFIALGLVFYCAKPDAKRSFLLATAVLAIVPEFSMKESHSAELINCVIPLLLMGAMGLDELLGYVLREVKSQFFKGIIYFLLLIFLAWAAQGLFSSVYPQWAEKRVWTTLPQENALQDIAQGRRVYLTKEIFDYSMEYYEGSSVYLLHEFNPIYLDGNEKTPDVVVYFIEEGDYVKKLKEHFPDLKFEGLFSPLRPGEPSACRCEIPAKIISSKNQKLFSIIRTSNPVWKRTYNYHLNPIRGSIDFSRIDWEDRVVDVTVPLPEVAWEKNSDFEGQAFKLESTIQINHSGQYEVTCKTGARTKVMMDGNVVFDLKFLQIGSFYQAPAANRKITLNLTAGEHQVEVITLTQPSLPDITLRPVEFTGSGQSLWKSFSF
jgi:hypothetical protein